jgi:hypothetical protein
MAKKAEVDPKEVVKAFRRAASELGRVSLRSRQSRSFNFQKRQSYRVRGLFARTRCRRFKSGRAVKAAHTQQSRRPLPILLAHFIDNAIMIVDARRGRLA